MARAFSAAQAPSSKNELIRLKRVKVYQRSIFGGIRVFRPVGPAEGAPQPE